MILLSQDVMTGKIVGWMTGADTHELRRMAQARFQQDVAAALYRFEFPAAGQYEIANDGFKRVLLLV